MGCVFRALRPKRGTCAMVQAVGDGLRAKWGPDPSRLEGGINKIVSAIEHAVVQQTLVPVKDPFGSWQNKPQLRGTA